MSQWSIAKPNEAIKVYPPGALDAVVQFEDKIEALMSEFGDDPAACLSIIGEYIQNRRHYREHPNAPRSDEYA